MLELLEPTQAKIADYGVLSDKDRAEGDNPGAALDIIITTGNDLLTMFDGGLRSALYTKNANSSSATGQQGALDGIDPVSDLPDLTGFGRLVAKGLGLGMELTGYTMTIDQGLGGQNSAIELENGKLSGWHITPKPGGSCVIKFKAEFPNVAEKVHGKLALLKTRELPVTLRAPEVDGQAGIEE